MFICVRVTRDVYIYIYIYIRHIGFPTSDLVCTSLTNGLFCTRKMPVDQVRSWTSLTRMTVCLSDHTPMGPRFVARKVRNSAQTSYGTFFHCADLLISCIHNPSPHMPVYNSLRRSIRQIRSLLIDLSPIPVSLEKTSNFGEYTSNLKRISVNAITAGTRVFFPAISQPLASYMLGQ